jgi:hypothetical protein
MSGYRIPPILSFPGKSALALTLLAATLFVTALLARQPFCTDTLFISDAADYIRADRVGFWTQYTGADSIPVANFLSKYRSDAAFRLHPWGLLYQQNDGAALRHFHVPAGFYLSALAEQAGWSQKAQREIAAILSALTIVMIFLMLCHAGVPLLLAFGSGLFLCVCTVLKLAGTMLSPHALFSLSAVVCMFAFCTWLETRKRAWLAVFSIACGVSIATLELSPLLVAAVVVTFAIWWFVSRGQARDMPVKPALAALAASAGVAAILWPGGILRGGYLLSYGVFVFQGLFRSGIYFQQRGLASSVYRLGQDWVTGASLVLLLGFVVWAAWRNRKRALLIGFAVLSVLFFAQGTANGFRSATYASHAVFAIVTASALAIHILWARATKIDRWAARAALGLILVLTAEAASGVLQVSPESVAHDPERTAAAIRKLSRQFPPATTFVVSDDPQAFLTYAPQFRFFGAASVTASTPETWERPGPYYLLFDREAAKPPAGIAFCDPGHLNDDGFLVSCNPL